MRPKPVVVATDGTSASRGAVHIGRALAERDDCPLHLIAVMKPQLVHVATSMNQLVHLFPINPKQSEVLRMAVLAQVRGAEDATRVPAVMEIEVDTPAPAMVRQGCAAAKEISSFHRA
jgi:nucleotide-binding universal stress UspA family protein